MVTIIEHGPQLAGREDPDVAQELRRLLDGEGIASVVSATPLRVWGRSGDAVGIAVTTASGEQSIEGSHLLVAVGRRPNTEGIGLDVAGVTLDDRGTIGVSERTERRLFAEQR